MKHKSKRLREAAKNINTEIIYKPGDAIEHIQSVSGVKFDQTMDFAIKLGIDLKKVDQQVRGTVSLPHGTGKKSTIVVFAKGDKAKEAEEAGADFVGADELADKILQGWTDFTAVIATPDMMRVVGKLGKKLGPRGLMPSPKAGTITQNVANAVQEIKAGKIEFKVDKGGNIHTVFGKFSFAKEQLLENFQAIIEAILRAKPASVKGSYIESVHISSTMGLGLKVEYQV